MNFRIKCRKSKDRKYLVCICTQVNGKVVAKIEIGKIEIDLETDLSFENVSAAFQKMLTEDKQQQISSTNVYLREALETFRRELQSSPGQKSWKITLDEENLDATYIWLKKP